MNTITLIVGDFSDGMERNISCNLTSKELEAAFEKGEEIIGIRFQDHFLEYGNYELPISMIKKMSKFFETGLDNLDNLDDDDVDYIIAIEYLELWLKIAKVGNPELDYEFCKSNPYIHIGGYGLFSNS